MSRWTWVIVLTLLGAGFHAAAEEPGGRGSPIGTDVLQIRDPFRMPIISKEMAQPKSELELYPVHSFKMTGIVTGPKKLRAMLTGPDGKIHFVSESDKIGIKKGFVRKISAEYVEVLEKVVNVLGQEETVITQLELPPQDKPQ